MKIEDPDIIAEIEFLNTSEGGRSGYVKTGYNPHHKIKEDYLTSGIHEYIGKEKVFPGETVLVKIKFITPEVYPNSIEIGQLIDIQEGSKLVAKAKVIDILNLILIHREG
ncbi:MAG: hypothetical protein ABUK01_10835 [Leptospirales bacterium]